MDELENRAAAMLLPLLLNVPALIWNSAEGLIKSSVKE